MSAGTGFLAGLVDGISNLRDQQDKERRFQAELQQRQHEFDFLSMMKEKEFEQNTKLLEYNAAQAAKQQMFSLGEKKAQFGLDQQKAQEAQRHNQAMEGTSGIRARLQGFLGMLKTSPAVADLEEQRRAAVETNQDTSAIDAKLAGYSSMLQEGQSIIGSMGEGGASPEQLTPQQGTPTPTAPEAPAAADITSVSGGGEQATATAQPEAPPPSGNDVMKVTAPGLAQYPPGPQLVAPPRQIVLKGASKEQVLAMNQRAKLGAGGKAPSVVFVNPEQLSQQEKADLEAKNAIIDAKAKLAQTDAPNLQDFLKQRGIDLTVNARPERTVHRNVHSRFQLGGIGITHIGFGYSGGFSEKQRPTVEFEAGDSLQQKMQQMGEIAGARNKEGPSAEDAVAADPTLPLRMANALKDYAAQNPDAPNYTYAEAGRDLVRTGRDAVKERNPSGNDIISKPFDAVLDPKNYQAARIAAGLPAAEEALAHASEGEYEHIGGYPKVIVQEAPPSQTMGRYQAAVEKAYEGALKRRVGATMRDLAPGGPHMGAAPMASQEVVDQHLVQELASSLKPDNPDGTYSSATQAKAAELARWIGNQNVSDTLKAQTLKVLEPIAVPSRSNENAAAAARSVARPSVGPLPATGLLQTLSASSAAKNVKPNTEPIAAPASEPAKTAEKPKKGGGPVGLAGLAQLATLSSLGATTADPTKAMNAVQHASDRGQAAKDAVRAANSASSDEQKALAKSWPSQRGKWKQLGVPDSTLTAMDEALGISSPKAAAAKAEKLPEPVKKLVQGWSDRQIGDLIKTLTSLRTG